MAQLLFEEKGVEGNAAQDAKDIALCKSVWEVLDKHYPGHPWMVGADHFAGVVTIQLAYEDRVEFNYSRYGFLLHIRNLDAPESMKKVMRAGGEMLERWKLARSGANQHAVGDARRNGIIREGALK